jgi:hypothetical protein
MELRILNDVNHTQSKSKTSPFIEGNTAELSLEEIQRDHVIPVFIKDNEPAISHGDFVETVREAATKCFSGHSSVPAVRVSHPIKGRVPSAKSKAANELLDHERTLYFERMAFAIEFPGFQQDVEGNCLNLTVGGVKAYNLDNFYNNKGVDEHFKVFVGFKNTVCTNLSVWSADGFADNFTARSLTELYDKCIDLFRRYGAEKHLAELQEFSSYQLTESQFAQILGRCRLYQFLPADQKKQVPLLKLNDTQLGKVAEAFYKDPNFSAFGNGEVNLWRIYNMLTGANKSSYIDTFLGRAANAHDFVHELANALKYQKDCWFLN